LRYVDECLADQLPLPLALAGAGLFLTHSPTRHTKTNIEVIARFLPARVTLVDIGRDVWRLEVGSQKDDESRQMDFSLAFPRKSGIIELIGTLCRWRLP